MVNALALPAQGDTLAMAYAYCERLAREHYENSPVASRLLPASMRPHLAAIYAFARRADDFADEPGPEASERLRLIDAWGARLDRGVTPPDANRASAGDDFIFLALEHTIRTHRLPPIALSRSSQRVSTGCRDDAVRDMGRPARLLPSIRQSGGPARASGRRLR